ncbi:MAG TPA: hypothetical protein VFM68_04125 [Candidatus Saccharimonadales bacterium]|nr:hypothetical protein [Candidatus Saccharimonadales bacterium]
MNEQKHPDQPMIHVPVEWTDKQEDIPVQNDNEAVIDEVPGAESHEDIEELTEEDKQQFGHDVVRLAGGEFKGEE